MKNRILHIFCVLLFVLGTIAVPVSGAQASQPAQALNLPPSGSAIRSPIYYQFNSGGHILAFSSQRVYFASPDHALSIQFMHTPGAQPQVSKDSLRLSDQHAGLQPLERVTYPDIWPGIRLFYEMGSTGFAKSTYIVSPGADPSQIHLSYNLPVHIEAGALQFDLPSGQGELRESPPVAWQEIDGRRVSVPVSFILRAENEVGFQVGDYDPRHTLVIDPTYEWHTFYGSSNWDSTTGLAVDNSGNLYITGYSNQNWLGPGNAAPLHAHSGSDDILLIKLDSNGIYQWHTFYGSSNAEKAQRVTVENDNSVYITAGSNATWQGDGGAEPLHPYAGGSDLTILKLNTSGVYQWHTFYGSSGIFDILYGIATDSNGNVYASGSSELSWQGDGGANPIHAHSGGLSDLLVLKLDSNGVYQWHTFYGSSGSETGFSVVADENGFVYAVGDSSAYWLGDGGTLPLRTYSGGGDMVAIKLDSNGVYQWHTFYGSSAADQVRSISLDHLGNLYLVGGSDVFWLGDGGVTPIHMHSGSIDIFVLKLDSNGAYQWHTFYGGSNVDFGLNVSVDMAGNVYVSGYSIASWLGDNSTPPLHAYSGGQDLIIFSLNNAGAYQWHTFYGSNTLDRAWRVALDPFGNIYATGESDNTWLGDGDTPPLHAYSGALDTVTLKLSGDIFLLVNKDGDGSGTVTSNPPGIDCGLDCAQIYSTTTTVTLTAVTDPDSSFVGWSGACTGIDDCALTMTETRQVTATFSLNPVETYTLTVGLSGEGSGAVSSDPPGIDCGLDCTQTFTATSVVTLTAAAAPGSNFAGWSGACIGSDDCALIMTETRQVTATFSLNPVETYTLTVGLSGEGSGVVSSDPPGIDCGLDCTQAFTAASVVTLTAVAAPGSIFAGWSGACTGTGNCVVNISGNQHVVATFTSEPASGSFLYLPLIQKGHSVHAAYIFWLSDNFPSII